MDNIGRLVDQAAIEAGCTNNKAKIGIYLNQMAASGKTLDHVVKLLRRDRKTVEKYAREFMIDFPDYRPYERYERAGKDRPEPKYRLEA